MNYPHLNLFAAVGTIFETLLHSLFTIRTGCILKPTVLFEIRSKFGNRLFTTITHNEGVTFFHPQHRDEKQTEVVIHPFEISLVQPANRAAPGVLVQHFRFGGYAGDEDHKGYLLV